MKDDSGGARDDVRETSGDISPDGMPLREHLIFIKPVMADGRKTAYAVYSEEGSQLAIFATPEAAYFSARQHNLTPVGLH